MRSLTLSLVLLAACGAPSTEAPTAPTAPVALASKSPQDQLDALSATVAALREQLAAETARAQQAEAKLADNVGVLVLKEQGVGTALATLDGAVFGTDPETGLRVNKIEALIVKQKRTELDVGELGATTCDVADLATALYVDDASGAKDAWSRVGASAVCGKP